MLNLKIISKILGSLLWIEATLLFLCLIVAIWYNGSDIVPFFWSIIITVAGGIVFRLMGWNAESSMGRRDAYFVVAVSWVLFSLFGTLPFLLSGQIVSLRMLSLKQCRALPRPGQRLWTFPRKWRTAYCSGVHSHNGLVDWELCSSR